MSLYLVISLPEGDRPVNTRLAESLAKNIADSDRLEVSNGIAWIVSFNGSASELSDKINAKGGGVGRCFIALLSDISGYGPTDISDWMSKNGDRNVRG